MKIHWYDRTVRGRDWLKVGCVLCLSVTFGVLSSLYAAGIVCDECGCAAISVSMDSVKHLAARFSVGMSRDQVVDVFGVEPFRCWNVTNGTEYCVWVSKQERTDDGVVWTYKVRIALASFENARLLGIEVANERMCEFTVGNVRRTDDMMWDYYKNIVPYMTAEADRRNGVKFFSTMK